MDYKDDCISKYRITTRRYVVVWKEMISDLESNFLPAEQHIVL